MTASSLPAALLAGARGLYALEAATGLIIAHASWLAGEDFARYIHAGTSITDPGTKLASIDWEAAIAALNAGELPGSGVQRMLKITASLADGIPVGLRDTLTGLDDRNRPPAPDRSYPPRIRATARKQRILTIASSSQQGEQRMGPLTASLAGGVPVDLRQALTGLDQHNLALGHHHAPRLRPATSPRGTP